MRSLLPSHRVTPVSKLTVLIVSVKQQRERVSTQAFAFSKELVCSFRHGTGVGSLCDMAGKFLTPHDIACHMPYIGI